MIRTSRHRRSLAFGGVAVSASVLLAIGAFAGSAGAAAPGSAAGLAPHARANHPQAMLRASHTVRFSTPADSCYSNAGPDAQDAIVSQNFTDPGFSAYDSAGADDVEMDEACTITSIDVAGQYFNGTGPADSETVTVYADGGGVPGSIITQQTAVGTDSAGTFTIPLQPFALDDDTTYWVSVVANMAFGSGGEWGWEVSSTQQGAQALWENPGGGFGACPAWGTIETCVAATGPDFIFSLNGTELRYQFSRVKKPKGAYTTHSCAEGLGTLPDGTILSSTSDPNCHLPHSKGPFTASFSIPMEKLSVPATWPNWGSPPNTEGNTPAVLSTQGATSVTISFNSGVKFGGVEAEPTPGSGVHTITASFYSGANGTGILLGTSSTSINSDHGAKLLGAHCKFLGWGSLVVSSDVGFAIAQLRV